jgi:hypothetical protein
MLSPPIAIRDLALMPGLFAAHAPAMISHAQTPPSTALFEYARESRQLLRYWWHGLDAQTAAANPTTLAALAEEVLVSELTSRVVAGVFAICDARAGRRAAGPFARSALLDLMQAKHWVLSRIVRGPQPLGAYLRINQLRRKTERWCDCLLGTLPESHAAIPFAVDAERMRDFSRKSTGASSQAGQYLTLVSLRLAMPASVIQDPQRCDTYRAVMRSLISFWPTESFDAHGLLRGPLWQRVRGLTDLPVDVQRWSPQQPAELEVINRRLRPSARLFDDDRRGA